jgi:hypothetical protein
MSPGCLLREKEYRDGWHKWKPGDADLQPASDHPSKVLFDTSGDVDITIFPRASGTTRIDESKLRKQNTQIRIGRTPGGELVLNLKTEDADYHWPLDMAQRLAEGIACVRRWRSFAGGVGALRVRTQGRTLVAITDTPVHADDALLLGISVRTNSLKGHVQRFRLASGGAE